MKFINALVVKLVDTTDLKSVPFWSASSSLAEGTNEWKVAVNKELFVYDNVYDLTYCIQHKETKVAVVRLIPQTVDLKSVPFLECQFESSRGRY
jgi:hypothetical protein